MGVTDKPLLAKLFHSLDVDGDGLLSFSEFAAGILVLFTDLLEDQLHKLFLEHDRDSDGSLDKEEAGDFLSNAMKLLKKDPEGRSKELVQKLLHHGHGKINYDELRTKLQLSSSKGRATCPPTPACGSLRTRSRPQSRARFQRVAHDHVVLSPCSSRATQSQRRATIDERSACLPKAPSRWARWRSGVLAQGREM